MLIDYFGGNLGDIKYKEAGDLRKVLDCLKSSPRFSIFDATANMRIAKTMSAAVKLGYIEIDNSEGYPWSNALITDKGSEFLNAFNSKNNELPN